DVKGWTKISGYIIADQNYTWISIGNFLSEEKTLVEKAPAMERRYGHAEACYYLDDVTVRPASTLRVTGDTLVDIGKKASLIASGAEKYSWADSTRPGVIIGTGPNIQVGMRKRTTYYVYGENDTEKITVNVRKIGPVYQDTIQGRKVRKGRTVTVESDVITISVYDKNEIDGDSITLYYGDSLVVQNLALTKKKQSFTIKVDRENPQQLILFAENQGSTPPNTACIIIKDGKNNTQIVLASDFKWCDSIMIAWKKED
ncbi:MAG TPA: hypothetical protein VK826_10060, partial [Bacteroidia bacterium]|nr:hypothetical protein [Bacteroidia bacterium]